MVLARLSRAGAVDGSSGRDCRVPVEGRSCFREDGLIRDWGIWELHGIAPDVSHTRGGGGGDNLQSPGVGSRVCKASGRVVSMLHREGGICDYLRIQIYI